MMPSPDHIVDKALRRSPHDLSAPGRVVRDLLVARVNDYAPTPMPAFTVRVAGRRRRIRLKLEGESPWQSIKGRTAVGLVASVAHRITERSWLAESTSGNLGVALAGLTGTLHLPFTAVADNLLPSLMRRRMQSAGARVLTADAALTGGDRLASRIKTVAALCADDPHALWTNQYENPANPLIHEMWTGPELLTQATDTQAVFVGASTGGTLRGVVNAVRRAGRPVKVVGADVEGSRVFGGLTGPRVLTGIGASRPSKHLLDETCDAVEIVPGWAGVVYCRAWEEATGLALGGSSGAVLAAAVQHLGDHPGLSDVVCVCPDLGENYAETIYDDTWVETQRARLSALDALDPGIRARFELVEARPEPVA